jgi:hypothetical protein
MAAENKTVKLSALQCRELDEVIASQVAKYKTEYIICLRCLSEAKTTTRCFAGDIYLSDTHNFLLMITTVIARIEHQAHYVNTHFEKGTITIVVHGMETVTNAITQGSLFLTQFTVMVCNSILQAVCD